MPIEPQMMTTSTISDLDSTSTRANVMSEVALPVEMAEVLEVGPMIDRQRLAEIVAERCEWSQPSREETVDILVALTLYVSRKALSWRGQRGYGEFVGVLHGLDIPELAPEQWLSQVIAARDLGLLDRKLDGPPVNLGTPRPRPGLTIKALITAVWEDAMGNWAETIFAELDTRGPRR
jgi:hypothetical protein